MSPVLRRMMFATAVVAAVAVLVEMAARFAEPGLSARTLPLPLPSRTRDPAFEAALAEARRDSGGAVPLVFDESAGWTLPPNRTERYGETVMRFNALGMRGPDWGPAAAGSVRILTLGDSSIMGLGVMEDQVFSSVAATALSTTWGVPVEAVIGGIPGHTSAQALELQGRVQARLAPQWVVLGCLWSDLVRQGLAPRITPPSRWATYRVGVLLLSPWLTARKVKFLDQKGDVGDLGDASSRVGLREYRRNLILLAERAKAGGARPAFLLLPAPMDLDAAVPPETVVAYRATMRSVAAELGAPLVDGEALVDARSATLAWWDDQVHPSALGHKELGVALAEALAPHRP